MIDTLNSPHIVAATSDSFTSLVLENSHQGPVLVNYWSKKAGPCLRQYPVLDKLVHHYAGKLLLVNIDADTEIRLTRDYGIASVPTLKLFRYGEVTETWHGYQSEEDLCRVLDKYVVRESDQVLLSAIQLYTAGKQRETYEMIANAIVDDPLNPRLPLTMCKLLRHEGRIEEAMALMDALPPVIREDAEIAQQNALLSFQRDIDSKRDFNKIRAKQDGHPEDLSLRREMIAHFVLREEYEQALKELVVIIEQEPDWNDNYAQGAMLSIFTLLGEGHELISQYRSHLRRYTH